MNILFLHGWHSVPGGVKPTYLARHGHVVINLALDNDNFTTALSTAQAEFDKHKPAVIVGSSRGGAVAMNLNAGDTPLVLLCPAWRKYGSVKTVKTGTVILHSRADDVVPFSDSEELIRNSNLNGSALIETGSDHRLADPDSLETMLVACLLAAGEPIETYDDLLEEDWTGLCYIAAIRWVSLAEEDDWIVVHGTVWSDQVGKRIEHAWCERAGFVVDLAMPVGTRIVAKETYYRSAKPEVSRTYPSDVA